MKPGSPLVVLCAIACAALPAPLAAQTEALQLVSRNAGGTAGNGPSDAFSLSRNGRFVAFLSRASDLVPGDTNGCEDVFVHDRVTGVTRRASVSSSGGEQHVLAAPPATWVEPVRPFVSEDGEIVLFTSNAPDLVAGDSGAFADVFVHDFASGATIRVDADPAGGEANGESGALLLSLCYGGACPPRLYPNGMNMTPDGRFVAYTSSASNLVTGDANGVSDVFVHDRALGTTEIVSLSSAGGAGSEASYNPVLSDDGRFVAFVSDSAGFTPGDVTQTPDVFVRDRLLGTTACASLNPGGVPVHAGAFYYYVHIPHCIPCGGAGFYGPPLAIAGNGSRVAFEAYTWDMYPTVGTQHRGAFVRDLASGTTLLASVAASGFLPVNGYAQPRSFSADGRFLAFTSNSYQIHASDPSSDLDLFVRDLARAETRFASAEIPQWMEIAQADMASDGHQLAYTTAAALLPNDQQLDLDVYARGAPTAAFAAGCEGTPSACPCGNAGAPGAGCGNSASAAGARLSATGRASVADDTVLVTCSGLPNVSVVRFVDGTSSTAPVPFGDGLLCTGGNLVRFGTRAATNGSASYGGAGDALLSQVTGVPPGGAPRYLQCWYRNAAPFCTSATWNLSNSIRVDWF